jgi:hypothetical protein
MTALAHSLSEAALLELWEAGEPREWLDRALLLLWATRCEQTDRALADWPIGARDAALLRARRDLFGAHLAATADCPACAERMAFELDLDVLAAQVVAAPSDAQVRCGAGRFRLPTSRDLAQAIASAQPRHALAASCRLDGDAPLDDAALDALDAAFAAADPAAQIDIALRCAACGHPFTASFDIAECLWADVARTANRTLDDVHLLAQAYGWSESDVLAVPPARRRRYLARVTA